jgi:hypothetical protein
MRTLNETQKDFIGGAIAFTMFWAVIGYFTFTQPDYTNADDTTKKIPLVIPKVKQSPILEKYGELITKNK